MDILHNHGALASGTRWPMTDTSWEGLKEKVEDGQRSGGTVRKGTDYPFSYQAFDVRNEFGTIIGEMVIEELIPLKPTGFASTAIRGGIRWAETEKHNVVEVKQDGAFPDEDGA